MSDRYDPMTGELLSEAIEEETKEQIVGYDPMTGEPIYGKKDEKDELPQQQELVRNFDPMTGKPVRERRKKGKWFLVLGVVAVFAIIIFAGIKSGLFLSNSNKVLIAIVNTLEEQPRFVRNLNASKILTSNSYTVSVEAELEDIYGDLQYCVNSSEQQVSGSLSCEGLADIDFVAALTSSQIKLKMPDIDDRVLVYNYKDEKDGYITEVMDEDEIESIDKAWEKLYSPELQKNFEKKVTQVVLDEYHSLNFKKTDKKEFEINGKDRKCKGYQTTITEDNFINICDGLENVAEEEYEDTFEDADMDDLFDDLRDELEDIPDMDITFYIYKDKIACINLEVESEEIQILFKGGEKGAQSIEVVSEDYGTLIELKGSVKGTTEKYKLEIAEEEFGVLEYNYKSGDFTLEIGDNNSSIIAEGNLTSNSKGMTLAIDELDLDGSDDITCMVSIKKGASMQEIRGEEFDLGNASESELSEFMEDLDSALDF